MNTSITIQQAVCAHIWNGNQINLRGILQNDQPHRWFLFRAGKQQIQDGFFARFGVENFLDLAAGKEDDLHGIFSRSMVLDLLHEIC